MRKSKKIAAVIVPFIMCVAVSAVQPKPKSYSWNFSGSEISDILYAVSLDTGIPIAADNTVEGKASFRFAGCAFEDAFDAFLHANRLYVDKSQPLWTVSRVRVTVSEKSVSVDACGVLPAVCIEKLADATGAVITYDMLPAEPMTLHVCAATVENVLSIAVRQFSGYEMKSDDGSFHISHLLTQERDVFSADEAAVKRESDGTYTADIRNAPFAAVAEKLFGIEHTGYSLLANGNVMITRSSFAGFDFDQTLGILCAQCSFDFIKRDGIYFIIQGQSLRNEMTDIGRTWRVFALQYCTAADFLPLLAKQPAKTEAIPLPDRKHFICCTNDNEAVEITALIAEFDVIRRTYLVKLKFAKTADFVSHLPPSVDSEAIKDAGDGCSFFFTGTDGAYKTLQSQLALCDRPVVRISYDLLIMQYEETADNSWSANLSVRRIKKGDINGMSAQLGSVLSFNLDVVTAFGLSFAAGMQAALSENHAHVFADTTIHGVSGKTINFQNTNTYRYRDNNIDPETGKPLYTGITREISSGLKLEILGWVSGDGMITSKVTASVSRQGKDASDITGNPPPTTEKVITTEVRGRSGEPVVLSGLIQNSDTDVADRIPLISKIPIVGALFRDTTKTKEKTQMVIYLIPHAEENESSAEGSSAGTVVDDVFALSVMKRFYAACCEGDEKNEK